MQLVKLQEVKSICGVFMKVFVLNVCQHHATVCEDVSCRIPFCVKKREKAECQHDGEEMNYFGEQCVANQLFTTVLNQCQQQQQQDEDEEQQQQQRQREDQPLRNSRRPSQMYRRKQEKGEARQKQPRRQFGLVISPSNMPSSHDNNNNSNSPISEFDDGCWSWPVLSNIGSHGAPTSVPSLDGTGCDLMSNIDSQYLRDWANRDPVSQI